MRNKRLMWLVVVLVLVVGVAVWYAVNSNRLRSSESGASYGYQNASVTLLGKQTDGKASFGQGPLFIAKGKNVDLKWESKNTKSCRAVNGWTTQTAPQSTAVTIRSLLVGLNGFEVQCVAVDGRLVADQFRVYVKGGGYGYQN